MNEEFEKGYKVGIDERSHDHDFIEKVIDSYLIIKGEIKDKSYMSRYDIIEEVIKKIESI